MGSGGTNRRQLPLAKSKGPHSSHLAIRYILKRQRIVSTLKGILPIQVSVPSARLRGLLQGTAATVVLLHQPSKFPLYRKNTDQIGRCIAYSLPRLPPSLFSDTFRLPNHRRQVRLFRSLIVAYWRQRKRRGQSMAQ